MSMARGAFLKDSETFSLPESHSRISNIMITELFYSHIFNMNRGSPPTRNFRRTHVSVLDADKLIMALQAKNVSGKNASQSPFRLKHLTSTPSEIQEKQTVSSQWCIERNSYLLHCITFVCQQTTKRSIPMLFLRGDGVILVSPPLRVGL